MRIRSLLRRLRPAVREARLRLECSSQYPHIKPGRWLSVRTVLRRSRESEAAGARRLPEDAFEFRGGAPRRNPAWPLLRQRAGDEASDLSGRESGSSPSLTWTGLPWRGTGN